MTYNPNEDLIQDMSDQINKVYEEYDIVLASESELERNKANNKSNAIRNALESAYGRGMAEIGAQSYDTISKVADDKFIGDLVLTDPSATSLIPPRAVGPLEEIPVGTLFQDSIMLQNIVTQTKVRAEHKLEARLAVNKSYKKKDLFGILPEREIKNQYTPENPFLIEEFDRSKFTFFIQNMAYGINSAYGINGNFFPAYITNYSESVGASWDAIHFANAIEDRYIYQKTDRSFTLEFILFVAEQERTSDSVAIEEQNLVSQELAGIPRLQTYDVLSWEEFQFNLKFLNGLLRPKVNSKGMITQPPMCYMTIGNHIESQMCIFEGLTLNYDPLIWDLNYDSPGFAKPMFVGVTLTGKYLHADPSIDGVFYKELNNGQI